MNGQSFRMFELATHGFGCSQILIQIALEEQKRGNPDLVRAMTGLLSGMGCGRVCGALTGACCVLGLYAGKGSTEEREDPEFNLMLHELVDWFEALYIARYGSIECAAIVGDDPKLRLARCPEIVAETFCKVQEILSNHQYDLSQVRAAGGDRS